MLRTIFSVSLLAASLSGVASPQGQPSTPPDSVLTTVPGLPNANATATHDTTLLAAPRDVFRRPVVIPAATIPKERSGICGSITRWKCIAYGTLIGAVAGAWVGDAFAPQPEYRSSGGFFSSEICVANCGTAKIAVYFAAGGSVLGGVGGWIMGR